MDVEELRRSQRRHRKARPERPTDIPLMSVSGSQDSDDDDEFYIANELKIKACSLEKVFHDLKCGICTRKCDRVLSANIFTHTLHMQSHCGLLSYCKLAIRLSSQLI
ncbi:hypothetical protein E2C01_086470 [Portunus trituberculatus]|uniref:Uncharacterized protein n=1 Tax=Portunus trituberculatus TaxID=210409 RepID=A0A5B7JAE2_PORTR|nr:hypothetical protein [Portunus trituberculatus]